MEIRRAKINISAAGGTAGKGCKTCKLTLPTAWVEALGLDPERRNVELAFDGMQITVSPRLPGQEFVRQKRALKHKIYCMRFYNADQLCTTLYSDFTDQTLVAENHVENPIKTAFGNNPFPCWADFQAFMEERCVPRQRAGLRHYLEALGLDEYDPLKIIQKTQGRMAEDEQWLEVEELV